MGWTLPQDEKWKGLDEFARMDNFSGGFCLRNTNEMDDQDLRRVSRAQYRVCMWFLNQKMKFLL